MNATQFFVVLFLGAGALSACSDRADTVASPNCVELATGKLSEAQQIELAKKCPRAGPSFKPSPARNW
ncbi:entry exclusion lipoprotein TrbK [Massilia sp. TW-1]|uniref:Entry exclusion lipoprotein TrbK n=1 Tax=Telluria antibiotica TaxID=2717319 RepID=A0ABX0PJK4_9BURK|nr:entry exclusion lipoprotein TrbK [Telluria antibiotica]